MEEKNQAAQNKSNKKAIIIIIACLVGALILCAALIAIIDSIETGGDEFETYPPLDPLKLHETYDEDFDIMEYDEYLALDRTVYLNNKQTGVTQSISEDMVSLQGEGFAVVYYVLQAIIEGDCDEYNRYMGTRSLKKDEFTQQQIYDIEISPESNEDVSESGRAYEKYIFKVTYRIHENNGTYRDNIESDAARAQYFVIDDRTGEFLVTEILEPGYIGK